MTARLRRDGTYAVRGHSREYLSELGYSRPVCSCGYGTFPCPDWHEVVDALIEKQVNQLEEEA